LTVNSVFNHSFLSLILKLQEKLNLSTEQIEKLKKLQSEFRKETLKENAELQVAEIELDELQLQDPLDLEKVNAKLKQIEAFKTNLRLAYIQTIENGKALLKPEQQKNLQSFERTALVYPTQEYFSESSLRQQIQTGIEEQFKDQKVVEIETAEAIATRLSNWAKLLGFFVGIPLALLGLSLGFFGIKTYDDLEKLIKQIEPLKDRVESLKTEGKNLENEYQALKTKLTDYQQLEKEVKTLATRVKDLEDRITFKPSAVLTPELKRELEASLAKFQKYFQNLGYQSSYWSGRCRCSG
jgi:predicted  nucleic acid-binding Zn-ribbon protein